MDVCVDTMPMPGFAREGTKWVLRYVGNGIINFLPFNKKFLAVSLCFWRIGGIIPYSNVFAGLTLLAGFANGIKEDLKKHFDTKLDALSKKGDENTAIILEDSKENRAAIQKDLEEVKTQNLTTQDKLNELQANVNGVLETVNKSEQSLAAFRQETTAQFGVTVAKIQNLSTQLGMMDEVPTQIITMMKSLNKISGEFEDSKKNSITLIEQNNATKAQIESLAVQLQEGLDGFISQKEAFATQVNSLIKQIQESNRKIDIAQLLQADQLAQLLEDQAVKGESLRALYDLVAKMKTEQASDVQMINQKFGELAEHQGELAKENLKLINAFKSATVDQMLKINESLTSLSIANARIDQSIDTIFTELETIRADVAEVKTGMTEVKMSLADVMTECRTMNLRVDRNQQNEEKERFRDREFYKRECDILKEQINKLLNEQKEQNNRMFCLQFKLNEVGENVVHVCKRGEEISQKTDRNKEETDQKLDQIHSCVKGQNEALAIDQNHLSVPIAPASNSFTSVLGGHKPLTLRSNLGRKPTQSFLPALTYNPSNS